MNKLEDIFKKSLENAEAPYDAKAWDSLASKLDQVMPITQPKGTFKWAWVAGVVLVAGSASLIFFNQEAKTEKIEAVEIANNEKTILEEKESTETFVATEEKNSNVEAIQKANPEIQQSELKKTILKTEVSKNYNVVKSAPVSENKYVESLVVKQKVTEVVRPTQVLESISVEKEYAKEITPLKIDFTASNQTFYEKGLPFNSLSANVEARKYTWTNERGEILSRDKNADIHLFASGTHQITLTIENLNGEKQSVTKPVRCEVNYNLLAVTGFNPSSNDTRNNTFLPFALLKTERNVPFNMQIIDPKTGQVIFETKNADNPWDGMDRRTNQMVPVNSTYIWRVNIQEKAIGEPTNRYQGTITRI